MSRIGQKPIVIPETVIVVKENDKVSVKGPKGELWYSLPKTVKLEMAERQLKVIRQGNEKKIKAAQGTVRAIIANMVKGVTEGYEKRLELLGAGYRAKVEEGKFQLVVGFSHPIVITPPTDVEISVEGTNVIIVRGADKQKVGQLAAKIRSVRPPEPYKGKGVRYQGEVVRRKAGKAATKVGAATPGGGQ